MNKEETKQDYIEDKQVVVPQIVLEKNILKNKLLSTLYVTRIGFFPKITYHFRERLQGSKDNIFFYCTDGRGYFETHLGNFTLTPNHFIILPANRPHRYYADISNPWTIYWVHYSGHSLHFYNRLTHINQYARPNKIEYDSRFIPAWEEMYYSLKNGYKAANIVHANLCLYRFISLFINREVDIKVKNDFGPVMQSLQFMRENIDKMLSVNEMATKVNYSESHFSKLFREKMGKAPMEYLIQLKINHACQLLDQSDLRINEIAGKVGYDDPYHFSKLFSKIMGRSPSKYRSRAD